jgi:hypothetical protein
MARAKSEVVRIYNNSRQMIALQVRAPGADFYTHEQQVRINPGKDVVLPKTHLREEQIKNLQAKRLIKVVYDSSTEKSV